MKKQILLCVAISLGLADCTGSLQAQTLSANQPMSTSSAAQAMDTPLPNKVMGQVPFTVKYAIAGEITAILQHLPAFPSPYSGPNSLRTRNETEPTHTYTLYLVVRPTPRLEVYLNPEVALGHEVSTGTGLAGYSNGDLIGQPLLPSDP